jgi:NAD(P)-dependent dehydrogenase (short-subunit alcohol dehydrogenase family)
MQAGARPYPEPPLPAQRLAKPGNEADLDLEPMYDAPHYKGSEKLQDKVALVTGGDFGIGRSSPFFAREGADIAIAYLTEDKDAEETKRAELGKLDVLVNNAAFQEHVNAFEDLTEAHFDRTLKTNLYGCFHMAKAAVPVMKAGGSIIMTGSVTGLLGNKDLLAGSV